MKKAIDADLLQEIVDYIVNKPYREVAMLVEKLKTQAFEEVEITPPKEDNTTTEEPTPQPQP